jgi:hypothetical protein
MKKKMLLVLAAGAAAVMIAIELPEMIRYYKMTRL